MKARSLTVATVAAAALALAGSAAADVGRAGSDVYGSTWSSSLRPADASSVKPGDVMRVRAHRVRA